MVINNSTTDAVVEAHVEARALKNIDADDDVGCAPTEIDSESSASDLDDATQGELQARHRKVSVECTTIDSDVDDANQGELRCWKGLTNMAHHINLVNRIPEINWHLPEPKEACDIFHGTRHIRDILNMGVRKFKIGITGNPGNRWSNRRFAYQHKHYSGMNVIYVFENSDDVAAMETALIGCYRRFDRSGKHVGNPGHHLCRNRAPGGEGAHIGHSPFFVYVVYQNIAKSNSNRRWSG